MIKTCKHTSPLFLPLALWLTTSLLTPPAFAVSKEIIQLQTQVQNLQEQMARMQQTFDERMGVMRSLVEQSADNVNKMNAGVTELTRSLQQQTSETGGKVDQVSGQVQALHDSLDELKTRLTRVSKQLEDMNTSRENIPTNAVGPSAGPSPGVNPPLQSTAPPADALYNNALGDYTTANYPLATQEFTDYLRFYGNSDRAGNAQFYLADIEYKQGRFQQAVADYDKVLEQYPGGNKAAAAQLKKGLALLELGQRDSAAQEMRNLIARYPRSPEATQARERLRRLGVEAPAPSPRPRPRRPR